MGICQNLHSPGWQAPWLWPRRAGAGSQTPAGSVVCTKDCVPIIWCAGGKTPLRYLGVWYYFHTGTFANGYQILVVKREGGKTKAFSLLSIQIFMKELPYFYFHLGKFWHVACLHFTILFYLKWIILCLIRNECWSNFS